MKKGIFGLLLFLLVTFVSCSFDDAEGSDSISLLEFEKTTLEINVGDSRTAYIKYVPQNVNPDVTYSLSNEGVAKISGQSREGVVVTGLSIGTSILIAKCNGITAYLEIKVGNNSGIYDPYIVLPYTTLEVERGKKVNIIASLFGGSGGDNYNFNWYTDSKNITIESASNSCVVNAISPGVAKITVSHPKSEYSSSMLIVIPDPVKSVNYLTTENNVIKIYKGGNAFELNVNIAGKASSTDNLYTVFTPKENKENISIVSSNGRCSVSGIECGISTIEVSNYLCSETLLITVIVSDSSETGYIVTDNDFIVIESSAAYVINASVIVDSIDDYSKSFTYLIEDDSIIDVSQNGSVFYVYGKKDGITKIILKNTYSKLDHEILVVVQDFVYRQDVHFIACEKSIVKTEIGSDSFELNVLLTGGNESDKNNFIYTVSDSSVIEVLTNEGNVNYTRAAVIDSDYYETKCMVIPKGIGKATIEINHPKSDSPCYVTVIVYPKGVLNFSDNVLVGPEVVRVPVNGNFDVNLKIDGNISEVNNLSWNVSDESICSVLGNGLNGTLRGLKKGITLLTVSGEGIAQNYSCIVICGNEEDLLNADYFYLDSRFLSLDLNSKNYFEIKKSENLSFNDFEISVSDQSIINAFLVHNVIGIEAKGEGRAEIVLRNRILNDLYYVIYVEVFDSSYSLEYPFSISGPDYIGIVKGKDTNVNVNLDNSLKNEDRYLSWFNSDENIVSMQANGNQAVLKGLAEGQSLITVSHPSSRYPKYIYSYVVSSEEELNNSIFLFSEKNNYIVDVGDSLFLKVLANKENIYSDLIWSVSDAEIVNIESNDNMALLHFNSTGNVRVDVSYESFKYTFFISVKNDEVTNNFNFDVPEIIELIKGDSKKIKGHLNDLNKAFADTIEWTKDSELFEIEGNGDECYIKALGNGTGYIYIRCPVLGINKKILVSICSDISDMKNSYLINISKSVYSIKKGSTIDIDFLFGTYRPSAEILDTLEFECSNNFVDIESHGSRFSIKGCECGSTDITVKGEGIRNELKFSVNVYDEENSLYTVACQSIVKLKVGETTNVSFSVINTVKDIEEKNYQDFEIRDLSNDCINVSLINNNLRVKAVKNGSCIIKLYSPSYNIEKSIIVYCGETDEDLSKTFVFGFVKDHYLLGKNSHEIIKITTLTGNNENLEKMKFDIEDPSVCSIEKIDSVNYKVCALKEGSTSVTFRIGNFSNILYISVSDEILYDEVSIFTENLLVLNKGDKYVTHVLCDREVGYAALNSNILNIVRKDNNYFEIEALDLGMCDLEFSYQNEKRVLRIFVVSDGDDSSYINIDKRYYHITKGQGIKVNPFFNIKDSSSNVSYSLINDNNTISFKTEGNSVVVVGLNTGIGTLKVNYKDQEEIVLYFEVSDDYINNGLLENVKYNIYSDTSVLYLEPGSSGGQLQIYVDGLEGSESLNDGYIWTCSDENMVSIRQFGYIALVTPLVGEGECNVTVSHPQCSNVYSFKIKIGNTLISEGNKIKYIYVPVNTVGLDFSGDSKTVEISLKNVEKGNVSDIRFENSKAGIVKVDYVIREKSIFVTLTPLSCGYGRITLSHKDCEIDSYIDYVVNDDSKSDVIYFTTSDNYVVMKSGESKELNVTLKNYDENNGSNFRYEYDSNYLYILGEGNRVSLYAVKEGITSVKVYHPKSNNYLTITVNISNKNINQKYITTSLNVIETSINSVMDSFMVTLVGDSLSNDKFTYTSSDYSVLSVVGNNNYCFYRGVSKGTAQITISNTSDPGIVPLTVTVVVEEGNTDGQFITSSDKVMYLSPNGPNKTVNVEFVNVADVNDSRIEWSIYSQENTDSSVGEVIKLNYSGKKGVITPLNKGIAKIRVSYPSLKLKFDFAVFVSEYGVISFADSSIVVSKDEVYFENIYVPSVSNNLDGIVRYTVDNDSILNVFGTSKVCCIKGLREGTAIVKAYNTFDDSFSEISVKVVSDREDEFARINVNQSSFLLNPRSLPQSIKASVYGRDVTVTDSDNIEWSVEGNKSVYIYPTRGSEVTLSLKNGSNGFVNEGDAVITARFEKDNQVTTKKIFVSVNELQNFFTLNNPSFTVDTGNTVTVTATILGASNSDYDDIVWSIDKKQESDGSMVNVAQVLNDSGRTCTVMGIEEGNVTLYCWYKGSLQTARISVKGNRYFSVLTNSITMFPDQEYTIGYNLRPASYGATWFTSCEGKVVSVINDNHDTQEITIKAHEEGLSTITGVVNGIGTVIINVKVEYNPMLINRTKQSVFEIKMFDYGTANYNKYKNSTEIDFLCYPPEYYVDFKLEGSLKSHLDVQVEMNHDHIGTSDNAGIGKLIITASKEIPDSKQVTMTVTQYEDREKTKKVTENEFKVMISAYFYDETATKHDDGFSIYWKRYDGGYSMGGYDYDSPDKDMLTLYKSGVSNNFSNGKVNNNKITVNNLKFGEGETHYLIVEPKHKGQYFDIDGSSLKMKEFDVQDFTFEAENNGRFIAELKTYSDEEYKDVGFDCYYDSNNTLGNTSYVATDRYYPRFAYKESYIRVGDSNYYLDDSHVYSGNVSKGNDCGTNGPLTADWWAADHNTYGYSISGREGILRFNSHSDAAGHNSICRNSYRYAVFDINFSSYGAYKTLIIPMESVPNGDDSWCGSSSTNVMNFIKNYENGLSINFVRSLGSKWYGLNNWSTHNHSAFVPGTASYNFSSLVGQNSYYSTSDKESFNYSYYKKFGINLYQNVDWINTHNAYCLPSNNENPQFDYPEHDENIESSIIININNIEVKLIYKVEIRDCYRNYREVYYDEKGRYNYRINDIPNPLTIFKIHG